MQLTEYRSFNWEVPSAARLYSSTVQPCNSVHFSFGTIKIVCYCGVMGYSSSYFLIKFTGCQLKNMRQYYIKNTFCLKLQCCQTGFVTTKWYFWQFVVDNLGTLKSQEKCIDSVKEMNFNGQKASQDLF